MSDGLTESIERDARAMERMASAFEVIAYNSTTLVKLLSQWYDKLYPPKSDARDVTLTKVPDTLDALKESQGASNETLEEWSDLGPRERKFVESAKNPQPRRQARSVKKTSGTGSA